jgi:hypothetical protein
MTEPGYTDPLAEAERRHTATEGANGSDDLMARNQRQSRVSELTIDDVKVGSAHGAGFDAHDDLSGRRLGIGSRLHRQGMARHVQDHCPH